MLTTGLAAGLATAVGCAPAAASPLTVFGAASLADALGEAARSFRAPVRTVFAGSGEAARQVMAGAPADLLVLADALWMDRLEAAGAVVGATRIVLATNRLVVVAPADRPAQPLDWTGRIVIGDPDSVPAGRYAREMMRALGVWDAVQSRLITAADVRAVRGFVARGDVDLGVIYHSDALGHGGVRIVATPPRAVQPAIAYPAALTARAGPGAPALMAHLRSAGSQTVFRRHGFGAGR